MNYKLKYLKYKNKYLNLRKQYGGKIIDTVPSSLPPTQSWFMMPFILRPFKDIDVQFDESIEELLNIPMPIFGVETSLNNMLINFYNLNGIDLDTRLSLERYGYNYDNDTNTHIPGDQQEQLLTNANIGVSIDAIIQTIVNDNRYHGKQIIMTPIINNETNIVPINDNKTSNLTNLEVHCSQPYIFKKIYDDNFHGGIIKRSINIVIEHSDQIIQSKQSKEQFQNFIVNNNIDVYIRPLNDPLWTIKDQALIVFGGWGDRQSNLYTILKNYKGYVIYFSDKYNEWYSPLISAYISFIREYTVRIKKCIFLGWSMGGYAALHSSVFFPEKECVCISMVPQTINYKKYHNKIIIRENVDADNHNATDKNRPLIESMNKMYKDIPTVLNEHRNYTTKIYTLVGKSECNDYSEHKTPLYLDTLHVGAIINYPNVSSIIYNIASHRFLEKIDFISLLKTIENNFEQLYNNQNEGNKILSEYVNDRS